MLSVRNLTKTYKTSHGERVLFRDLSFDMASGARLAILGRNGQGKSTLIKILGGALWPNSGHVNWTMESSWPIGFGGAFQGGLSGMDNIRFISRIYRRSAHEIIGNTEAFAQLGEALYMPVKHYSSGMRARLAFGISLAIEFDCYLIDEIISVGDASFRDKCQTELFSRRADRAFIIASHDMNFIQQTCDRAIIIEAGQAKQFDDINLAAEVYAEIGARAAGQDLRPVGARVIEPIAAGGLV